MSISTDLRVPSKCFVVGEYAVLARSPAIVFVHDPSFELISANAAQFPFTLASPAGLLWQSLGSPSWPGFSFLDPHHRRGGFGGSTAEFLLVAKLFAANENAWKLWQSYRDLCEETIKPSGADLLAQSLPFSRSQAIYVNTQKQALQALADQAPFLVLRTGTKVATHSHLKSLETLPQIANATAIVEEAKTALEQQDWKSLGMNLNRYHEALFEQKLLHAVGLELRKRVLTLPGVLGAKTCGAQGADAVIACVEPHALSAAVGACRIQKLELVYPL